ncbi:5-oxoprolinase subunit PxpA [Wenyingzhuangia sp. IMCC45467]
MRIDINADLGEGFLFDEELMQMISSCNIACGGHTGTENSMRASIRLALKHHVTIGAHPSYPNPEVFGREEMDISNEMLKKVIRDQILTLIRIAREEGAVVRYVKPHGALYNKASADRDMAILLVQVIQQIEPSVGLMGLAGSVLEEEAKKGYLFFIKEGFADRRYHNNGTLVSRQNPLGVIHSKEQVWEQVKNIMINKKVISLEENDVPLEIQSICFHGDTPEAVELLSYVNQQVKTHKIEVKNAI